MSARAARAPIPARPATAAAGPSRPSTDASLLLGYLNPAGLRAAACRWMWRRPAPPSGRWPTGSVVDCWRPPPASIASSTPPWPTASGSSRSSAATTPGATRCVALRRRRPAPRRGPARRPAAARGARCPARPGVLSAIGLPGPPSSTTVRRRCIARWTASTRPSCAALAELDAARPGGARGRGGGRRRRGRSLADVRYVGQSYELDVPVGSSARRRRRSWPASTASTSAPYGYADPDSPAEVVGLRLTHRAGRARRRRRCRSGSALAGRRPSGRPSSPVWPRPSRRRSIGATSWRRAQVIAGPAIVEQADTTTVIYPGQAARRLPSGARLIRRAEEA